MPGGSCQPPRLCTRHYPHGLGDIGEAGGSQGSRWPQGRAGDISLPTPTCAAGETEARAGFPSGLGHRRALCTPELCQWAPRAKPSRDTEGCMQGFTHTHARSCARSLIHTQTHSSQSPKVAADPACLLAESRGWGTCASPPAPHQARAALPACTYLCPAPAHLRVGSKPRNWGSSTQRRGAGGPGTGTMHPSLVTQAFV